MNETHPDAHPFYRVDRFVVPASGRAEFLDRVAATHALLRKQDGFIRDLILERQSGPGEHNVVTLVEWAHEGVVETVSAAVKKLHADMGFDPRELIARLGIRADIGGYRNLDGASVTT